MKKAFWILLIICVVTVFPFLGLYEYNTKGEPREAIVSYSMLATDNWILPRNNGGETAYKPPFFHWCVAAVSTLNGKVTEATSRIPSAIALIALVMSTFVFFARRKNATTGFITAMILFLSMEIHRAGGNCRVDMVLTALTVGAFYLFYRWYEQGAKKIPLWTILLMSLATLTKGPVGTIIPCCVIAGFMLLKKENFFKIFGQMLLFGILSLIIPAIWYYAAYQQGGQEFVDLMYEENIGRMTNTMAYDSCVEPWWFNFLTLVYGLIPFTLLLVFGLFSLNARANESRVTSSLDDYTECSRGAIQSVNGKWSMPKLKAIANAIVNAKAINLFSLSSAVIIIVFYCIPQSKRSVYLMPMYPFLAYFIAQFMMWLARNGKKSLIIYTDFLAFVGLLLFAAFIVVKCGVIPDTIFEGKHAPENILTLHNLADLGKWWEWIFILIPTLVSLYWWRFKANAKAKANANANAIASLAIILSIYLAVDAAYKPAALNAKSSKYVAADLRHCCTKPLKMYEYIESGVQALGDPVHYFEVNFYLDNTIGSFHKEKPPQGYLLIGAEDMQLRRADFERAGYTFSAPVYISPRRVAGQILGVYEFSK